MLPVWADAPPLSRPRGAVVRAWQLRRRVRESAARLQARERERPLPRRVSRPAADPPARLPGGLRDPAALELRPLPRRPVAADPRGLDSRARGRSGAARPARDDAAPYLGEHIDAQAAPAVRRHRDRPLVRARCELLPGTARRSSLHLPLYSGDMPRGLPVARLDRADRRARARARSARLLAPLTASLHASRNWEIAVTDELSGPLLAPLLRDPPRRGVGPAPPVRRRPSRSRSSTSTTSRRSTTPSGMAPATWRSADSARSSAPPCARATSPAATAAKSSPSSSRRPAPARPSPSPTASAALSSASRSRARARPFRVTVSAGVADTDGLAAEDQRGAARSAPTRPSTPPRTRAATGRACGRETPARPARRAV